MTMIGYDPGRLAGGHRARRAAEVLETARSDDPAAAGAMAAVTTTRRHLEDGVLALIGRITTSDAMGSWITASVTEHALRNCSQPQPALCENTPVRSWFGPGYEVFGGRVTIVEWLRIRRLQWLLARGAEGGHRVGGNGRHSDRRDVQRRHREHDVDGPQRLCRVRLRVRGPWWGHGGPRSHVRRSSATWKSPNTGSTRPSNRRSACRSEGHPARGPAIRPPSWTSEFRSNTR